MLRLTTKQSFEFCHFSVDSGALYKFFGRFSLELFVMPSAVYTTDTHTHMTSKLLRG